MAELTKDEARLLAVHRAIKAAETELVGTVDIGEVVYGIEILGDLDKREGDFTAKDIKTYLQGVVAGIAASRAIQHNIDPEELQYLSETVSGGPTGGVVAGQGTSEDFVTQTGPRDDQEVE